MSSTKLSLFFVYRLVVVLLFSQFVLLSIIQVSAAKSKVQKYALQSNKIIPPPGCRHPTERLSFVRLAISPDGKTIAVGCPSGFNGAGGVTVYAKLSKTWTQQGSTLHGTNNHFPQTNMEGNSLALSRDASILAVSAVSNHSTSFRGSVFIYTRRVLNHSSSEWVQEASLVQENPLLNETNSVYRFGSRVALSYNGKTLATTGTQTPTNNQSNIGIGIFVRNDQGIWSQQGPILQPKGDFVLKGELALSQDGNTVAMTATGTAHMVGTTGYTIQVFQRNKITNTWKQYNPAFVNVGSTVLPGSTIKFARGINTLLSVDALNKTMSSFELTRTRGKDAKYRLTGTYTYEKGFIASLAVDTVGSVIALAIHADVHTKTYDKLIFLKRANPKKKISPFKKSFGLISHNYDARIYYPTGDANRIVVSGNGRRVVLSTPFDFEENATINFYESK